MSIGARIAGIEASRFAILLAVLLAACAPQPPRGDARTLDQASPNFDERRPNFVIIHATGTGRPHRRCARSPTRAAG
jgi:hypothetical protein